MISIKTATIHDATFISLLGRITFGEAFGHLFRDKNNLLEYYNRTFSVSKIQNSLGISSNKFWIAFVDDLPVGYAKLKLYSSSDFIDSKNVCQLQKIYVLNDFLSMKIGSQMQNMLLNEAQNLGFEKIWLSVWDGNKKAIRFYERNDFVNIGTHNFQIGKEGFNYFAMSKIL